MKKNRHGENRSESIQIRCTKKDKTRWTKQAEKLRVSLSKLITDRMNKLL